MCFALITRPHLAVSFFSSVANSVGLDAEGWAPLLHMETLVREPLVVMAATPLPARMRLADVADLQLVLPSRPNALRQLLEKESQPKGLTLKVVAEVDFNPDRAI